MSEKAEDVGFPDIEPEKKGSKEKPLKINGLPDQIVSIVSDNSIMEGAWVHFLYQGTLFKVSPDLDLRTVEVGEKMGEKIAQENIGKAMEKLREESSKNEWC
jgi:hypothetical protein